MRVGTVRAFVWATLLLLFLSVWSVRIFGETLSDIRAWRRERKEVPIAEGAIQGTSAGKGVSGALFELSAALGVRGAAIRVFPRDMAPRTAAVSEVPRTVKFLGSEAPKVVVLQDDRVWGIVGVNVVHPEWVFFDGSGGVLFSSEK